MVYKIILEKYLYPSFDTTATISEQSVQEFVISKLSEGTSVSSVKSMVMVLKMPLRYAAKRGLCEFPSWELNYPHQKHQSKLPVFSIDDQRILMRYLTNNACGRNVGILICLNTGMRIGEMCALTWGDIDIEQHYISVTKTLERVYSDESLSHTKVVVSTPKTMSSYRCIPLPENLINILRPLKEASADDETYVLSNMKIPIEPRTYRNYFHRLLRKLNIPPIKFHGLRHSFATRCIESQCDYKTVSSILGHSNISTTLNLYVHPNFEQKKRCIEQINNALSDKCPGE